MSLDNLFDVKNLIVNVEKNSVSKCYINEVVTFETS